MSFPLGLAVLDALLPIVGASFLALFGVADSLGAGVRLLGLAYLTGWALLGVVMSLLLMAGLSLSVASIAVVAAVLFLVCAVWARRRPVALLGRPRIPSSRVDVWVSRIGAVVLCVGGAAAVVVAIRGEWNPAHDFDALFFYLPRADSISTTHGLHAALWRQFPHPEYPPLFPVTTAAIFVFAGFHPSLQPFQQTLLGLAFLLGMLGMLDRVAPRRFSVPSLTLLATTPWFWGSLQSLLPDQTVAYLIAAAALACALWLLEPHPAWLALGTLFLAAGTLTKLEGMLSAVTLAAVVVVTSLLHFGRRGAPAALLLLGPATIVFWRIWLHANGLRGTSSVYTLSDAVDPTYLDHRVARLRYAARMMTVFWAGMLSRRRRGPARNLVESRGLAARHRTRRTAGLRSPFVAGSRRRSRLLARARLRRPRHDLLDRPDPRGRVRGGIGRPRRGDTTDGHADAPPSAARPGCPDRPGWSAMASRDTWTEPTSPPPWSSRRPRSSVDRAAFPKSLCPESPPVWALPGV